MNFDNAETRTGDAREGRSPYFFGGNPVTLSPNSHQVDVSFDRGFGVDENGNTQNIQGIFFGFSIYLEGEITVTFTIHFIL